MAVKEKSSPKMNTWTTTTIIISHPNSPNDAWEMQGNNLEERTVSITPVLIGPWRKVVEEEVGRIDPSVKKDRVGIRRHKIFADLRTMPGVTFETMIGSPMPSHRLDSLPRHREVLPIKNFRFCHPATTWIIRDDMQTILRSIAILPLVHREQIRFPVVIPCDPTRKREIRTNILRTDEILSDQIRNR